MLLLAVSCFLEAFGTGNGPMVKYLALSLIGSIISPVATIVFSAVVGRGTRRKKDGLSTHSPFMPSVGWFSIEHSADAEVPEWNDDSTYKDDRETYERMASRAKMGYARRAVMVLLIASLVMTIFQGVLSALMALFVGFMMMSAKRQPIETFLEESARVVPGIYRVIQHIGPITIMRGVAYSDGESVTSSLHVTGRSCIWYENRKIPISLVAEENDIISWGALPKIEPIKEDDKLVVLALHPTADYVVPMYSICARLDGISVFRIHDTAPGISGSPFFVVREQPEGGQVYLFAGTVGLSVKGQGNWQYEVQSHIPIPTTSLEGTINPGTTYQVFSHPGAGKSRATPIYVKQLLTFSNLVIIAGPTRVVCREILEPLADTKGVGAMMSGEPRPSKTDRVLVTTHQTLMRYIQTSKILSNMGVSYIVDEVHMENAATRVLQVILRCHIRKDGGRGALIELTATGYDMVREEFVLSNGSNYPIEDRTYTGDVVNAVKEYMSNYPGKRLAVFCPSATGVGGVADVTKRLSGGNYTCIPLSRQTFSTNSPKIKKDYPSGLCIVTTSISECGANYDLDVVFDTARQFKYKCTKSGVCGVTSWISQAQMVQRRGRVGRRKEGTYYHPRGYIHTAAPVNDDEESIVTLEANMCLAAFGFDERLPCGPEVRRIMQSFAVTLDQASKWLKQGENDDSSLLDVWASTDDKGKPLSTSRRRIRLESLKRERCWDERMDKAYAILMGTDMEEPDQIEYAVADQGAYEFDDEGMFTHAGQMVRRAVKRGKVVLKKSWRGTQADYDEFERNPDPPQEEPPGARVRAAIEGDEFTRPP